MKRALKMRLVAFGLAIGLLAGIIGWAAYSGWREIGQLQVRLSTGHLRDFEIADHLQATILKLNNNLVDYDLHHDSKDWAEFDRASAELNDWIDVQKPLLSTKRELDVLNQVDAAYDVFLAAATNRVEVTADGNAELVHIDRVQNAVVPLLALGYQLEDAHRQALETSLVASQRSVSWLRWVIFSSLLLLLAALVWVLMTIYQEMIAPLQLKLVQTHAILERQEKLASLGVLAAGVAHEIRNPLTAIKARLFSHQRAFDKGSREFEDVVVIGNEINRLEKIIKDFLQFARPSEPTLIVINAETVLREVCDLLAPQFEKRTIRLRLGPTVPDPFQADPQQLKQVLINLIQNAAESIEHDGQITLRARAGTARLNGQQRPVVILETIDSGKGIPSDVQKRLFDPFFSTKESGTGLGLSIAARIIEKHGGALEFQTEPRRGTTFGILLPIYSDHDQPS